MATMKLQTTGDFRAAVYLGDDLGECLSGGSSFAQPVIIERMNGESEVIDSLIKLEGGAASIEVFRELTDKRAELRVPATTSPLDAEDMILSLTLELLLS